MTPACSAALSRVLRARRERDAVETALCGLRSPAAALALLAHFAEPLPDARAILERRAERAMDAHAAAMRDLGHLLSQPPNVEAVS